MSFAKTVSVTQCPADIQTDGSGRLPRDLLFDQIADSGAVDFLQDKPELGIVVLEVEESKNIRVVEFREDIRLMLKRERERGRRKHSRRETDQLNRATKRDLFGTVDNTDRPFVPGFENRKTWWRGGHGRRLH
jgi:hypothetical protein